MPSISSSEQRAVADGDADGGEPGATSLLRPAPSRSLGRELAAWVTWIGLARLVTSAVAVVVVVGGAFVLLRAPEPPIEAALPMASVASAASPTSTTQPGSGSATESDALAPPADSVAPGAGGPAAVDDVGAPEQTTVVVHVAGAVVGPGVYELPSGARIHAALDAAGGPAGDADLDGLNLAASLVDGQRVYVPRLGEVDPATVPSVAPADLGGAAGSTGGGGGDSAPSGPVDLNRATLDDLLLLPGIGPATAAAIVDDRQRNGPFATVDELERVAGIGPAKLAAVRDLVTV